MGIRNYLIEGVSGSGKTTVATELQQRGHHVIHGDRELAYRGDPKTGKPLEDKSRGQNSLDVSFAHKHHLWDIEKVRALTADRSHLISFFCGGSRNFHHFIELFDEVFVLDVDLATLKERLARRPEDEFGGKPAECTFVMRLHETKEDLPKNAIVIDTSAPVVTVVDNILSRCRLVS